MTDIIEFLTARLDEDEGYARRAEADWQPVSDSPRGTHLVYGLERAGFGLDFQIFACAFDPARVLREVAVRRLLLEWCAEATAHFDWSTLSEWGSLLYDPNARATHTATLAMQTLAASYSDHPDYDQAWTIS